MTKVENNLFVSVEYKGTLENGEVFDTSVGQKPLEVKMGDGQLIKGFENALLGMALNEKKTFTIDPENAYGQRNDDMSRSFSKSELPPEIKLELGQVLGLQSPEGQHIPAKVVEITDDDFTVDMNHPLAGETLTFEIEIVGISETATQKQEECGSGCDCSSGCC